VYAEPPGFDREQLAATLRQGWGIAAQDLTYVPVGFGTHHYRTGPGRWVNVDVTPDVSRLDKALRAVAALAEAGLEFVHAPLRRIDDSSRVAAMPGGYAVSVFDVIEGESYEYGEFPDARLRRQMLQALCRLHATRPAAQPEPDSLAVPHRDTVFDRLDQPWQGGPFGEPTRELIRSARAHIQALLDRYDELVPKVRAGRENWVVTHGEPHAGNVMTTPDGGIKLIDWDTVRLGAPERDLWMIAPRGEGEWAAYGSSNVDPDAIELYRRWWALSEICEFTTVLRAAHLDDANTRIAWRELQNYLSNSSSQPTTGSPNCA